jgi:molybdate transport system regulatory protein
LLKYHYSRSRITPWRQNVKVVYKIWLDNNGKAFGEGPLELLRRVEQTNSLHQAAQQMGMAYSKAWKLIQRVEKKLGFFLLEKRVGGLSGGGSHVTPRAKELMKCYGELEREASEAIEKAYRKHFDTTKGRAWKGKGLFLQRSC